ncbi:alcohol dehydrogenase catalytic domain-containing protein [Microbacterium betulae]|uniref:Alcohol dehydrogenase catalytic domain-containing protein n=1 Tax=Microbacterium betulae TaxID=2981139 RepID=A0AA97FGG5_9MICO|nr:alcohol dehydrogenase catalytic domain-containing protein [Microbacterium sp. AB]WOF21639.1 alcohol dehydrogenase catalytic domain-containing protein [Microbacterium sp. AB]
MRALTWQGRRRIEASTVPDPRIERATDAIVRITSTAICGSDLHLYEVMGPFLDRGDILGHEAMGVVVEVGEDVRGISPGQRVVVPFNIACGECFMCLRGLQSQCETTQVREHGSGAALFGYTKLYGQVPGGQAELLRVPLADHNTIRVADELPDERYLFLSDILPTAWQAVRYADVPAGGTLVVLGLGPVGQFAARVGVHLGHQVIGVDTVPERQELARRYGVHVLEDDAELRDRVLDETDGRGADSVVDAVGMEAHGTPLVHGLHSAIGKLPSSVARPLMEHAGLDRLGALHSAIDLARRGGTVSLAGVYAGDADPMPMKTMFDKQIALRMGQCNVKRWTDTLIPLVEADGDVLGTEDLVTHRGGIDDGPQLYETFQKKTDGCVKVVLRPA